MPNLQKFSVASKDITFTMNPDPRSNANGQDLTTVCQTHNLVPLNHLIHRDLVCEGGFTYRQKERWISQLDWALCSIDLLDTVQRFNVTHTMNLPTNHAPIAINLGNFKMSTEEIVSRSRTLGVVDRPSISCENKTFYTNAQY